MPPLAADDGVRLVKASQGKASLGQVMLGQGIGQAMLLCGDTGSDGHDSRKPV